MKKIFIVGISLLALLKLEGQNLTDKFSQLKGWEIEITENQIDTIGVKNWLPQPIIKVSFIHKNKNHCARPFLDLYPVEMVNYIENKLENYLLLRSSIHPPSPTKYYTQKYFILGWNLSKYNEKKCCACEKLKKDLKSLGLKETSTLIE